MIALEQKSRIRGWFAQIADALLLLAVIALPWSISVFLIFLVLWMIAAVFADVPANIVQEAASTAGGLPIFLFALACAGMFWSSGGWREAFSGVDAFFKLLTIPLLFNQIHRSPAAATWILIGYVSSCTALMLLSWDLVIWPSSIGLAIPDTGVPFKDAAAQGGEFVICAFSLLFIGIDMFRHGRTRPAGAVLLLALLFLANVFYVLILLPFALTPLILLLVLTTKKFGRRPLVAFLAIAVMIGTVLWVFSPAVRSQAATAWDKITSLTWLGASRPVYWRKSVDFIRQAPIFGNGSGSIGGLYARAAVGQTGVAAEVTTNPQQQTLAVGIQLGLVGIVVLWAMWLSHLRFFWGTGLPHWIGFIVVVQNMIGSLIASQLGDFTPGWIYVLGVGTAGGVIQRLHRDVRD